jgi:hypothetical protein
MRRHNNNTQYNNLYYIKRRRRRRRRGRLSFLKRHCRVVEESRGPVHDRELLLLLLYG